MVLVINATVHLGAKNKTQFKVVAVAAYFSKPLRFVNEQVGVNYTTVYSKINSTYY